MTEILLGKVRDVNLTQRQLRMFTVLAGTMNFSRASEALHLSQPALSRAMQEFESQLGVTLFHRSTRELQLSTEGRRFLPTAHRLLTEMNQALHELRDHGSSHGGTVTVSVGTAFACTVLPAALQRLRSHHPAIRVCIRDDNSGGITERVMRSEVDFGIGTVVGDANSLETQRLLVAPVGLIANPEYYKLERSLTADGLAKLPLLKHSDDSSIMRLMRLHRSDVVSVMERGVEASGLAVQLTLAQAGAGVAAISALGASHPAACGLSFVPLLPIIRREVVLMHRRDRPLRAPARALAKAVVRAVCDMRLHPLVQVPSELRDADEESGPDTQAALEIDS